MKLISPIPAAYGRHNLGLRGRCPLAGLRVRVETPVPPARNHPRLERRRSGFFTLKAAALAKLQPQT